MSTAHTSARGARHAASRRDRQVVPTPLYLRLAIRSAFELGSRVSAEALCALAKDEGRAENNRVREGAW